MIKEALEVIEPAGPVFCVTVFNVQKYKTEALKVFKSPGPVFCITDFNVQDDKNVTTNGC